MRILACINLVKADDKVRTRLVVLSGLLRVRLNIFSVMLWVSYASAGRRVGVRGDSPARVRSVAV